MASLAVGAIQVLYSWTAFSEAIGQLKERNTTIEDAFSKVLFIAHTGCYTLHASKSINKVFGTFY